MSLWANCFEPGGLFKVLGLGHRLRKGAVDGEGFGVVGAAVMGTNFISWGAGIDKKESLENKY